MATVKKFEDLISWQKARELTRYIYALTRKPAFREDADLKSQIRRAASSSMANQAEGFSRGTKLELINYFYIAKGSAGEVQNHLYVCSDAGYIDMSEFRKGYDLADQTQRLIESFVYRVKAGSKSGLQYRHVQKKDMGQEFLTERGLVFTARGVMKREEAEERGLEIL